MSRTRRGACWRWGHALPRTIRKPPGASYPGQPVHLLSLLSECCIDVGEGADDKVLDCWHADAKTVTEFALGKLLHAVQKEHGARAFGQLLQRAAIEARYIGRLDRMGLVRYDRWQRRVIAM